MWQKEHCSSFKIDRSADAVALQHKGAVRFAVYRAGRALISEYKKVDDWKLDLTGFDLDRYGRTYSCRKPVVLIL